MKRKYSRRSLAVVGLAGVWVGSDNLAFAQGSGKPLGKKELADLVAKAKSADDHKKLAAHYRAMAAKHEADAKEHTELAAKYKAHPTPNETKRPNAADTASHCLTYAEHCRKAAKSLNDLAAMHEEMAKTAK